MGNDGAETGGRTTSVRRLWESGDHERAYAIAVEETEDSLYRFLRHMLRDEEAAREVFQDTYIRVFRALGGFRGDASLKTWVLTIGRNVALNRIRRARGQEDRNLSLDELEETAPAAVEEPGDPPATRSLIAAVDGLPSNQREAVLLYYVEDRPVAEIAKMTGRTANTIKSDLLRARKRLRRILEKTE